MARDLLRYTIVIWVVSTSIVVRAENAATLVRVVDVTGDRIAGVVLLVNPGNTHKFQAFITDVNGQAYVPRLDCGICTISAMDPSAMFFSRTTEFNSKSSSVTLVMKIRPVIDKAFDPGSVPVTATVYGPRGELLPNQQVVVRPNVVTLDRDWSYMTLDSNWPFLLTSDPRGQISVELHPGEYTVATMIGEEPWEAPLHVTGRESECAEKLRKCIDSARRASSPAQLITVHLAVPSAGKR
jgi:hypothetical protein